MAILTQTKPGRNPAPEGVYIGIVVDVIDLGIVEHAEYGKKPMVDIVWQLEEVDPDTGQRFELSRRFNNSLNEKSSLAPVVEALLGRAIKSGERRPLGFDLESLLGKSCQLQIVHQPGKNGGTFARVEECMRLAKGMQPLKAQRGSTRAPQPGPEQPEDTSGENAGDERFPFEEKE